MRRVTYTASTNRTPSAQVRATPASGPTPLGVSFDGSGSSDPDPGDTLTYLWEWGDGSLSTQTSAPTGHQVLAALCSPPCGHDRRSCFLDTLA